MVLNIINLECLLIWNLLCLKCSFVSVITQISILSAVYDWWRSLMMMCKHFWMFIIIINDIIMSNMTVKWRFNPNKKIKWKNCNPTDTTGRFSRENRPNSIWISTKFAKKDAKNLRKRIRILCDKFLKH